MPPAEPRPAPRSAVVPGAPTRTLVQLTSDWVLPYWLERALEPGGPDHEPVPADGELENRGHREVIAVGALGTVRPATVDPRGLVTPRPGGWSLDWWIGADDRWHLPSREVAVRQRAVDDAPVAETTMRVPGGDAVCRTWVFRDSSVASAADVLAVEVENASRVPVAVALAIRPYGPHGAVSVGRIEVDGDEVRVDGRAALWLPRPPSRVAVSNLADGDVAGVVLGGGAPEGATATVTCPDGFAQAALVYPLAHTARLLVLAPLGTGAAPAVARRRRDPRPAAPRPTVVPPADAVAAGWRSHAGRGLRVELPDAEMAAAFAAARAQVLLAAGGVDLGPAGAVPAREVAAVLRALDRVGLHDEAAAVLATIGDAPGPDGRLAPADAAADATGAVLASLGEHWRLARDPDLVRALVAPVVAAAHHLDRRRRGRGRGGAPRPDGLVPSTPAGPGEVGPSAARFLDTAWTLRGLVEAAALLEGIGEPDAAAALAGSIAELRASFEAALTAARRAGGAIPAGPDRAPDGAVATSLTLVAPLDLLDPASPAVDATVDAVRDRWLGEGVVRRAVGATGRSPWLTTVWVRTLLRRHDPGALESLAALVALAGPTRTWPEVLHPRRDGAVAGDGSSAVAAAGVVDTIRELLVLERRGAAGVELVLSPVVPPSWHGAGWEVHGAPTAAGTLSYAVRWHGARPALLWELERIEGPGAVRIVAPGLDPGWATSADRGEALLAGPPDAGAAPSAGPVPPEPGTSFA